jgi:hypothetical protein
MSQINARISESLHKHGLNWRFPLTSGPDTLLATYLIVVGELLIAQDLALTIGDHDSTADVILASTLPQAKAALASVPHLRHAFVAASPDAFVESGLDQAIRQRGGRAILMGVEAEAAGPSPGWDVLPQPFTTDCVLALFAKG